MRMSSGTAILLMACGRASGDHRAAIPAAIAPALALLDSVLPQADRDSLRHFLPDSACALHMSLGLWIRNHSDLRYGPVGDSFRARGVMQPDDMSHVILEAYGYRLRGLPIPLDSLIGALPPPPPASAFKTLTLPRVTPTERPQGRRERGVAP